MRTTRCGIRTPASQAPPHRPCSGIRIASQPHARPSDRDTRPRQDAHLLHMAALDAHLGLHDAADAFVQRLARHLGLDLPRAGHGDVGGGRWTACEGTRLRVRRGMARWCSSRPPRHAHPRPRDLTRLCASSKTIDHSRTRKPAERGAGRHRGSAPSDKAPNRRPQHSRIPKKTRR